MCGLLEYSCVNILPQIAQISQRNTTSCIISQRKTDSLRLRLFWDLGFICVNLRDLRETLGFRLCGLLEYSCVVILPQMAQITQTNTAKLYYFAEKDRLVRLRLFWGFGGCLRLSARSAGDLIGGISLVIFGTTTH